MEWIIDNLIVIIIVGVALLVGIAFLVTYIEKKKWKEKIQSIKLQFGLIEGHRYNVLQSNGSMTNNLAFVRIYKGNRTSSGYINLMFTKVAKAGHTREVIIKYEAIQRVDRA